MQAGELDQRVTFRRKTSTKDGFGGATTTPSDVATVWAKVTPLNGREREQAMRTEGSSNYLIVIRNRDDILETDTAVWRGREMNIRFPKNKGPRTAWLEIECELGAPV